MLPYHTAGASRLRFVFFRQNHREPKPPEEVAGIPFASSSLVISCLQGALSVTHLSANEATDCRGCEERCRGVSLPLPGQGQRVSLLCQESGDCAGVGG